MVHHYPFKESSLKGFFISVRLKRAQPTLRKYGSSPVKRARKARGVMHKLCITPRVYLLLSEVTEEIKITPVSFLISENIFSGISEASELFFLPSEE